MKRAACPICKRTDVPTKANRAWGLVLGQHRMVRTDPHSQHCSGTGQPAG